MTPETPVEVVTLKFAKTMVSAAYKDGRRRGLLDAAALLIHSGHSDAAESIRAAYWLMHGDDAVEATADAIIAQAAAERAAKVERN